MADGGETSVEISSRALAALRRDAREAFPHECCGVLVGRGGRIERAVAVANVATSPQTRYEMDPVGLWAAHVEIRRDGLDVIGYYHSHPRTSAEPSPYDLERAYYPRAVYVIIGRGPDYDVRGFRIGGGLATPVELVNGVMD